MTDTNKDIVLPGAYLCSAEEYAPGKNTYADEDSIFAAVCGMVHYDGKTVSVAKEEKPAAAFIDVISVVVDRIDSCAFTLPIRSIPENTDFKLPENLSLPVSAMGGYTRSVGDAVRIGDVVKARVVRGSRGYEIAFTDRRHGVIKGFCSRCRSSMFLKSNVLICSSCGNTERRRLSEEYGFLG